MPATVTLNAARRGLRVFSLRVFYSCDHRGHRPPCSLCLISPATSKVGLGPAAATAAADDDDVIFPRLRDSTSTSCLSYSRENEVPDRIRDLLSVALVNIYPRR